MFKGDKVRIILSDVASKGIYEEIDMCFVGGGATVLAFSEVGKESLVYAFIPRLVFLDGSEGEDTAKDTLVVAYEHAPNNPYLPRIEFLESCYVSGPELNKTCKIYKMPHYRDLRQSDHRAWVDMKILHKLRADGMRMVYDRYRAETNGSPSMTFLGNEAAKMTVELAKEKLIKKNPALVEALEHLYHGIIEQGRPGLTFEFNRRNVGVDRAGNLVMRDPVYDSDITVRIKKDRKKREENGNSD
ncbi:Uncharacterised protein [uncultured archaeon]|nr:Uncharacterised protein [uncultured archaeon]